MGRGKFYKWLHFGLLILWAVMFPVAELTGLKQSLPFVVGISLYANWATEFGAYQASRAELRVDQAKVEADHADIAADAVEVG